MLQVSDIDADQRPIIVDLEGALLRSNVALEALFGVIGRQPAFALQLPRFIFTGRRALEAEIARRTAIEAANLPYNEALLAELRTHKAHGRHIILLSNAAPELAERISKYLGLFEAVLPYDDSAEPGRAGKADAQAEDASPRLEAIRDHIGLAAFDLITNDLSDRPALLAASGVLLATPHVDLRQQARSVGIKAEILRTPPQYWRDLVRAARPHQWLKNLLVFIPLVLAHMVLMPGPLLQAILAFVAFGLCASSVYLLNDLIDLEADRRHPEKRKRPFAAGLVPIEQGMLAIPALLLLALMIALLLPGRFLLVLAVYYLTTLAYSLFFKRTLLFDVLVLAGLYTLRLIAGAAAIAIPLSFWLLAFSVFLFFSLALLKRYVELQALGVTGERLLTGRGYRAEDLPMLTQFGVASALLSVLVLALYIDSHEVQLLYRYPEMLWLLCPVLLYLVTRFWILAGRNEMHEDPIVFAVRDWRSQVMLGIGVILLILASR